MKKKQPKPVIIEPTMYSIDNGVNVRKALPFKDGWFTKLVIRTLADDQERSRRIRELEKEVETLKSRLPIRLNFGDKFRRPKR